MDNDMQNGNGFLNHDNGIKSRNVNDEYKEIFDLAYDLNRFSHKVLIKEKIEYEDDAHVFIICSFLEIHKLYQSAIILFEKGLPESSRILIRSIYERLFKMKAVSLNRKNFALVISDSNYLSNKFNNLIMEKEYFKHLRNEIAKNKSENKYTKTNTKEWAKLAEMEWEYDTGYRLLSTDSHGDVKTMKENIVVTKENTILNADANYNDIDVDMMILINIFLDTLQCFIMHNKFERYNDDIIEFVDRLEEINGGQLD